MKFDNQKVYFEISYLREVVPIIIYNGLKQQIQFYMNSQACLGLGMTNIILSHLQERSSAEFLVKSANLTFKLVLNSSRQPHIILTLEEPFIAKNRESNAAIDLAPYIEIALNLLDNI